MTKLILHADNLAHQHNDHFLFSKLSFQLRAGQALQVEGINGAGKTTLLRILTGLLSPSDGTVFWYGKNIHKFCEEYNAELLYIGHQPGIKAELTVRENLAAIMALTGNYDSDINIALNNVSLANYIDTPCYQLSAGQQRRVALARLWLSKANIWILDEPYAALDKKGIENIESVLTHHLTQGGIAIVTSHQTLNLPRQNLRHLLLD